MSRKTGRRPAPLLSKRDAALNALASYFAGPAVAHFSICLQTEGVMKERAQQFFHARESCGIDGYVSPEQALAAVRLTLGLESAGARP